MGPREGAGEAQYGTTRAVQPYKIIWATPSRTRCLSHLIQPCHLWAFEGGPGAAYLHVIVCHEDGKTAQVVAFAVGVAIPAAELLAACGGPVPTAVITLPEGTD